VIIDKADQLAESLSSCLSFNPTSSFNEQFLKAQQTSLQTIYSWTSEVKEMKSFKITKELQLNDWVVSALRSEQNPHSLFGKSRPDFAFKKMDQLNHNITGIIVLDRFLEQVSGTMIEFKLDVSNDNLP